jgi:hypothetical protein
MATARAIASGNWSATGTWNGGVLPGNGDTVYANGFTVTIDQNINIGGANNPTVNAGSFVSGQWYEITTSGTTSFPGAAANTVGTIFQASGVGSGTGQARARATLTTASNAAAGASAGGGFIASSTWSVPCDLRAGTTNCLTLSGSANFTQSNLFFVAGGATNQNALVNTGTGTISVTSCTITANQQIAIQNTSTGSVVANSCVMTGPTGVSGAAIVNSGASPSSITITGSTIAGATTGQTILSSSTGTVNISTSTITGGSGANAPTVNITGAGTVNISSSNLNAGSNTLTWAFQSNGSAPVICANCTFTASSVSSAVNAPSASADYQFSGSFIDAVNGFKPITCSKFKLGSQPLNALTRYALSGAGTYVDMFTADNSTALNQAAPTDVRSGVAYGIGNSQTGRLTVPARGSVALSVNYGPSMPFTATRSGTTATTTLAYSYPLVVGDQITVTGASNAEWNTTYSIASIVSGTEVTFTVPATHSATAGTGALMQTAGTAVLDPAAVASAVWGAATRTITGGTVDTLTNAPTVPTAAAIATQVRTELGTELGRLDANISSRLAPSGTLAVVTTLTNAPSVPSAASIRAEIDSSSTQLAAIKAKTDLLPASPAATGDIPSANISAIKAKTDLLETTRLAQCSTVATTGAQLAAALS